MFGGVDIHVGRTVSEFYDQTVKADLPPDLSQSVTNVVRDFMESLKGFTNKYLLELLLIITAKFILILITFTPWKFVDFV